MILAFLDPVPFLAQPQIQAHFFQFRIGGGQLFGTLRAALRVGFEEQFLKIQRGILQPLRDDKSLAAREALRDRQEPGDEIVRSGENDHFFRHTAGRTP